MQGAKLASVVRRLQPAPWRQLSPKSQSAQVRRSPLLVERATECRARGRHH
jgi:hypothetical protein